jgi:hypothetical protein
MVLPRFVPRFVPVICNTRRTIASALGGPRLSDSVLFVCHSRMLVAFVIASVPVAYSLSVYLLSTREASAQAYTALIAIVIVVYLVNVVNVFQALLLNIEVLAKVVLRKLDTAWSLANVYTVALLGAYVFADKRDAVIWLAAQLQLSFHFLQDAQLRPHILRHLELLCYSVSPRASSLAR